MCQNFLAMIKKNVPENWKSAKFFRVFVFVGLVGTSLTGIAQRGSFTKLAALRAARFVHAPLQQIIEMTLYVTSQIKWAESQHETDARIHTVNSKSINVNMRVFIKIWIPAKAPATKVVWLESRILLTYYHDKIGARILLEVPEKCQSPHTHTQTVAALKYTSWPAAQAPLL